MSAIHWRKFEGKVSNPLVALDAIYLAWTLGCRMYQILPVQIPSQKKFNSASVK